jgi:hypothetical protein
MIDESTNLASISRSFGVSFNAAQKPSNELSPSIIMGLRWNWPSRLKWQKTDAVGGRPSFVLAQLDRALGVFAGVRCLFKHLTAAPVKVEFPWDRALPRLCGH